MGCLVLDGFNDLARKLEDYGVEYKSSFFDFDAKVDIWCRLTTPIHFALTIIRTVCVQTFRGIAFILTGAIHLDGKRVQLGLKDICSMLIQLVTLPILFIVTFIAPTRGYWLLSKACDWLDGERLTHNDLVVAENPTESETLHGLREGSANLILGITGMVNALINTNSRMNFHKLAHCLVHSARMRSGLPVNQFQASQQAFTMASYPS